jgi:protein-disulfide isomerase
LNTLLKAYPTQVRLIFKQFPLVDSHPEAAVSAAASLAAHQQGKFWQMHDIMFANHGNLSRKAILEWAAGLGLDMKRFAADLDSPAIKQAVQRDMEDGNRAGVDATPTVFIDGQKYNGGLALDALKPVIEAELKRLAGKPAGKGKG